MQNFSWATLFIKKDAKGENESDGQPKIQMRIILVLLHEEGRPVKKNREIELIKTCTGIVFLHVRKFRS